MDGKTKDSWAILPTNDMHGRYRPIPVIKVTATSRTEDAGRTWDEIDRIGTAGGFPALATAVRRIRWYWCLSLLALLATGCATSCREKVVEHPIPRLYGTEDSQFSRTMGTLLGMGILGGNQVDELLNGDEIFPAMLTSIRNAKTSITFETYIYWSASIGSEFSNALAERARAGVKVHVLLDWIGSSRMDAAQLVLMEQAGVQVRKYHKPHWYQLGRLNNRTHRKLLVVDGQTGFTGGVGIADQWSAQAQDPEHWRDSHYRVRGPVVAQMQAVFMDNWIKVSGDVLHGSEYFPPLQPVGAGQAHVFSRSPSGGSESMRLMYLLAITAASRSIHLSTPYFIPDALAIKALTDAAKRGVTVLGSTNFDPRSFSQNDEANINLYEVDFARRQIGIFQKDLAHSRQGSFQEWKDRPLAEKFWEQAATLLGSQL